MKKHFIVKCLGLAFVAGCGAVDSGTAVSGDSPSPELDTVETATSEQPLTGIASTNACTATEQALAIRAVNLARPVAASAAFANCVSATMAVAQSLSHAGSGVTAGPYVPQSGDPFQGSPFNTQLQSVLFAANSTSNVGITCGGSGPGTIAHAFIGSYSASRQTAESMTATLAWRDLAARPPNVGGDSQAANAIWHEAMHQWGYQHAGGGWTPDLEKSLPYIVGDCMETMINRSAFCANACGTNQKPVMRWGTSLACDCVDDPQYDVGVVQSSPSASCPVPFGRAAARPISFHLDDEDDDNENSRGGWIGSFTSDSNTTLRFCGVPGANFHPANNGSNYAVLRMGASCPLGASAFRVFFDNEDSSNENSRSGHIPPNQSDVNTGLQFCMFRSGAFGATSAPFPNLGMSYGVLAPSSFPGILASGFVHTDDEDSSNENRIDGDSFGSSSFVTGGPNTTLRLAQVK